MVAVEAAAEERLVYDVQRGADGASWYWRTLPNGRREAVDSTEGKAANGVVLDNAFTSPQANTTTAVEIGSVGGNGALGLGYSVAGSDYYTPGKDGGAGGTVSLIQRDVISGQGAKAKDTSLLYAYSRGGDGLVGRTGIGHGGAAGTVTVDLRANASTEGDRFIAVWVRSQGGQSGRNVYSASGYLPFAFGSQAAADPFAGAQGNTASVTIAKDVTVSTKGKYAHAVVAESLGGAGLSGGTGPRGLLSKGGAGGQVVVSNAGTIVTDGTNSTGLLLQSIGGHGGEQVSSTSSSTGSSGGGRGAAGGDGGSVLATQTGKIETKQAYSFGVAAYSIGGTGGKGQFGWQTAGGDGGAAGNGGAVELVNSGSVETWGIGSVGLVAQSLGGGASLDALQTQDIKPGTSVGGGAGGGSGSVFFPSEGGKGGAGGQGGTADLINDGSVVTHGAGAFGLLVQSVGGGGGEGGAANSAFSILLGSARGGNGGAGGDGGAVHIKASAAGAGGTVTTSGKGASAVVAQSVGGGGGVGGSARAVTAGVGLAFSMAIGGEGGAGGKGGKVEVDNTSVIATSGVSANGIEASSIGGGGGKGGSATSYAVAASPPGVPSIGVSLSIGGSGGGGGAGGLVIAKNYASITTSGDDGVGLLASSIGGGGGNGALASSLTDMIGLYINLAASVAIGGSGGGGGEGGAVEARNEAAINTSGEFAAGMQVTSIGGGGGNGGTANATTFKGISTNDMLSDLADGIPIADTFAVNTSIGGSGGGGGKGGVVTATNVGTITTTGGSSTGMLVQSIGGGGGNAGGFFAGGKAKMSARVGIGATGGDGGRGDTVNATNEKGAVITTEGDGAIGIHAQSVGGGGGTGGAFSDPKAKKSGPSAQGNGVTAVGDYLVKAADYLAKGNDLGTKIIGKKVSFLDPDSPLQQRVNTAKVFLSGVKQALASAKADIAANKKARTAGAAEQVTTAEILLKSVYAAASTTSMQLFVKNMTDTLKTTLKQVITTKAITSPVPLPVTLDVRVGGTGGKGGAGGDVTVTNAGGIVTGGEVAHGILAQSIGGGGGSAGGAVSIGPDMLDINMTLGNRSSGASGAGGKVATTNSGSITTSGNAAFGMAAQSIGGGGGLVAASANSAMQGKMTATVALGGSIAGMANGGNVTARNSGTITTLGKDSHGIVAQSVGGGGGIYIVNREDPLSASALASTTDEAAALKALDDILTEAGVNAREQRAAASAELISAATVTARFGGAFVKSAPNEFGGSGGNVSVTHAGTITTSGVGATGILAQSIGGGGGLGADASTLAAPLKYTLYMGGVTSAVNDIVAGGDGGTIFQRFEGQSTITTTGDGAAGVLLQSIGGGGGYGGVGTGALKFDSLLDRKNWDPFSSNVVDIASYGNGGNITVDMSDNAARLSINTKGKRAHGLFVQTLTGGGGAAFDVSGSNLPLTSTARSRPVMFSLFSNVSQPFYYVAPASGGALAARLNGHAGTVSIVTRGDIEATGPDSYGIYVQNGRQRDDGSIDTRVPGWSGRTYITHEGKLWGGSGSGAGIRIDGAFENQVVIAAGSLLGAESGTALISVLGNNVLLNHGTTEGDVNFGAAPALNQFVSYEDGTYRSRAGEGHVRLGNDLGLFTSFGKLDIGGLDRVSTLSIDGGRSIVGGTMQVDVNSVATGLKADLLTAKYIDLNRLTLQPHATGGLLPGTYLTINATGQLTGDRRVETSFSAASPISWLARVDGNKVSLTPSANFVKGNPNVWNSTELQMLNAWQQAWNSASPTSAAIFAQLANLTTDEDYRQAVDSTSSEGHQAQSVAQTLGARGSLNAALSCPIFADDSVILNESQCAWARVTGSRVRQFESSKTDGFTQNGISMRLGAQWEVAPDWFLGATAAYTSTDFSSSDGYTDTDGDSGDVALALKRQIGPWLLAASAHAGYGRFDTTQLFDFGSEIWRSEHTSDVWTGGLRLRAAYEFQLPAEGFYLRPYVDLDAIYTYVPGYQASQNEGVSLGVDTMREWTFVVSPAVEFGARVDLDEQSWLRPYLSVGASFISNDSLGARVHFDSAGTDGVAFNSTADLPDVLLDVGAGLQFFALGKHELRGEYRAQMGDNYLAQEASVRLSVQF